MVNTEHRIIPDNVDDYYNILNIVVNTEPISGRGAVAVNYNILNIVVNTEL